MFFRQELKNYHKIFTLKVTPNIFRMIDLDFCFENDFSLRVYNLEDVTNKQKTYPNG